MNEMNSTIEYLFEEDWEGYVTEEAGRAGDSGETAEELYKNGSYYGAVRRCFPKACASRKKLTGDELQTLNAGLCEEIKAGRQKAEEELIYANIPMLYRLTSKWCRRFELPVEDFEEILMDSCMHLVKLARKYKNGTAKFSTYAWRSLDLSMISLCKEHLHCNEVSLDALRGSDDEDNYTMMDLVPDEDASAEIDKTVMLMSIEEELEALPIKEHVIFSMAHALNGFDEKSPSEIAEALHISRQTVYYYLSRAVDTIRKRLSDDNEKTEVTKLPVQKTEGEATQGEQHKGHNPEAA